MPTIFFLSSNRVDSLFIDFPLVLNSVTTAVTAVMDIAVALTIVTEVDVCHGLCKSHCGCCSGHDAGMCSNSFGNSIAVVVKPVKIATTVIMASAMIVAVVLVGEASTMLVELMSTFARVFGHGPKYLIFHALPRRAELYFDTY